ncbi:DUF1499 domain-containing protein [Phormidium sp. CCY1219]|uniref:DUF1499 domain-containing protein n=1 Tax=Phormidium sp. CCY1219 TaxID=2886104 RepID=UPI002D1F806C|nr:DUF1499 domain-containing protein [Phormidium sp. CCY1219]MEB3828003.1 DUF1499 domain-containing protein [Phormidium sp. CCY1219]
MHHFARLKVPTLCISLILAMVCYLWQTPAVFAETNSPITIVSIFSFSGTRPTNLGVKNGKLAACPSSPNCVSSQAPDTDKEHKIAPLTYSGSADDAFAKLKGIIEDIDNATVVKSEDNYLYAEFSSNLMGFVDDVEFYNDPENQTIHLRSASRLGQSDLGVNRKRIESIREKFTA